MGDQNVKQSLEEAGVQQRLGALVKMVKHFAYMSSNTLSLIDSSTRTKPPEEKDHYIMISYVCDLLFCVFLESTYHLLYFPPP